MPTADKPCYMVLPLREINRLAKIARDQSRKFYGKVESKYCLVIDAECGEESNGFQIRSWSLKPVIHG